MRSNGGDTEVEGEKRVQPSGERKVNSNDALVQNAAEAFVPVFKAKAEDISWAQSGMVAEVIFGDSVIDIHHQVHDAGFPHVIVTPLGGDQVFMSSSDGRDIWNVFNDAVDFFSKLFEMLGDGLLLTHDMREALGCAFTGYPYMRGRRNFSSIVCWVWGSTLKLMPAVLTRPGWITSVFL